MGAIKDIVDLCIKLRNEDTTGKIAAALGQIQSLTLALQSEQATIVEKNAKLLTENLELKRTLLDSETAHSQAITALQEKHRAEIAKIAASNARPKGDRLDETTEKVLKMFFDTAQNFSDRSVAHYFKMGMSVASYHTDTLIEKNFIANAFSRMGEEVKFGITALGREYIVKNNLAG
jgi:hypothetical protein